MTNVFRGNKIYFLSSETILDASAKISQVYSNSTSPLSGIPISAAAVYSGSLGNVSLLWPLIPSEVNKSQIPSFRQRTCRLTCWVFRCLRHLLAWRCLAPADRWSPFRWHRSLKILSQKCPSTPSKYLQKSRRRSATETAPKWWPRWT